MSLTGQVSSPEDGAEEEETETAEGSWSEGRPDYFSRAHRVPVTLACNECKARNYKTTKSESAGAVGPLELKKFCKHCKKHTLHRETK